MKIEAARVYAHSIERVWQALTDPEALSAWLMPTSFKLEKGREFTFSTTPRGNFDGTVHCRVIDFEAPKMLSYSWRGGNMKMDTTVHWTLSEVPAGTKVQLVHSGFAGWNGWLLSMILGFGWKRTLLKKNLAKYLHEKA